MGSARVVGIDFSEAPTPFPCRKQRGLRPRRPRPRRGLRVHRRRRPPQGTLTLRISKAIPEAIRTVSNLSVSQGGLHESSADLSHSLNRNIKHRRDAQTTLFAELILKYLLGVQVKGEGSWKAGGKNRMKGQEQQ